MFRNITHLTSIISKHLIEKQQDCMPKIVTMSTKSIEIGLPRIDSKTISASQRKNADINRIECRAVSAAYLRWFTLENKIARDKTTREVCEDVVKEITKTKGQRYVEYIKYLNDI